MTTFSSPSSSLSSITWPDGVCTTRPVGDGRSASGGTAPCGYQVPTHSGKLVSPASNSTHTFSPTGGTKKRPEAKHGRAHTLCSGPKTDGTITLIRPCWSGSSISAASPLYLP